jgi:hypothetical protein
MQLLNYFVAVGTACSVYYDSVVAALKGMLCLHRACRNCIYIMHAITALLPTYTLRATAATITSLFSFMCLVVYVMCVMHKLYV